MENKIISNFINDVARTLKEWEVKDVIPVLAILQQKQSKLEEVLLDKLTKYTYEIRVEEISEEEKPYVNCRLSIIYNKCTDEELDYYETLPFKHQMEFWLEDIWHGYCQCKPEDKDYNIQHKCCGHECDWSIPKLRITYMEDVMHETWDGDAASLWKMEDELNNGLLRTTNMESYKADIEETMRLERQLKDIQKQLDLLKNKDIDIA